MMQPRVTKLFVIQAFIVCETEDETKAAEDVFTALHGAQFDSASTIIDFVSAPVKTMHIEGQYEDGSFALSIPDAAKLVTASSQPLSM